MLRNVYSCLKADAKSPPFKLLWNQIKEDLFIKTNTGYRFYYKPNLPRVFHIDQAVSGDIAAMAVCHVERRYDSFEKIDAAKDLIYVIDFVIPIHPFGGRINLDSIKEVITDLITEGSMALVHGSFDQFQSEATIQYLDRWGIEVENLSVDRTLDPYMFLVQTIEQNNLKMGRNIIFKNNLRSLRVTKKKISKALTIDHTMGETYDPMNADLSWANSFVGINAKDVSDAVAGAVYLAKLYLSIDAQALKEKWDDNRIIPSQDQVKSDVILKLKEFGLSGGSSFI
jgi:hypothetical protein